MSTPILLLNKMHHITIQFINSLTLLNENVYKIKEEILAQENNLDTSSEPYIAFDTIYSNEAIEELVENLYRFMEKIEIGINIVEDSCEHDWINDYIDISPDTSQPICYCSKCELTK